jgi:hypothetical protein
VQTAGCPLAPATTNNNIRNSQRHHSVPVREGEFGFIAGYFQARAVLNTGSIAIWIIVLSASHDPGLKSRPPFRDMWPSENELFVQTFEIINRQDNQKGSSWQ